MSDFEFSTDYQESSQSDVNSVYSDDVENSQKGDNVTSSNDEMTQLESQFAPLMEEPIAPPDYQQYEPARQLIERSFLSRQKKDL